jgi:hypothetical protein
VSGIAGVRVAASNPASMDARWTELGFRNAVSFQPAGDRGEGIDGVDLVATDRAREGESATICGVTFRLV